MLITANISLGDVTSVVGLGFAALAAYFAGRAVHYARQTVVMSEEATQAAARQHEEQIKAMRDATESQVREISAATSAATEQHHIEMRDRRAVAAAETLERQLRHIGEMTKTVLHVGNTLQSLVTRGANENNAVPSQSGVPSQLIILEGALGVLASLGVPIPPKTEEFARVGRHMGVSIAQVHSLSVDSLMELQRIQIEIASKAATSPD